MTKCLKLKVFYVADFFGLSIVPCTSIMRQNNHRRNYLKCINCPGKSQRTVRETLIRSVPTVKSQKFGIWLKDINRLSKRLFQIQYCCLKISTKIHSYLKDQNLPSDQVCRSPVGLHDRFSQCMINRLRG